MCENMYFQLMDMVLCRHTLKILACVFSDMLFVNFSPIPYQTRYLQIFSLILWIPFSLCYYHLIHKSFEVWMQSHLYVFAFVAYAFDVISKMSVPSPLS